MPFHTISTPTSSKASTPSISSTASRSLNLLKTLRSNSCKKLGVSCSSLVHKTDKEHTTGTETKTSICEKRAISTNIGSQHRQEKLSSLQLRSFLSPLQSRTRTSSSSSSKRDFRPWHSAQDELAFENDPTEEESVVSMCNSSFAGNDIDVDDDKLDEDFVEEEIVVVVPEEEGDEDINRSATSFCSSSLSSHNQGYEKARKKGKDIFHRDIANTLRRRSSCAYQRRRNSVLTSKRRNAWYNSRITSDQDRQELLLDDGWNRLLDQMARQRVAEAANEDDDCESDCESVVSDSSSERNEGDWLLEVEDYRAELKD